MNTKYTIVIAIVAIAIIAGAIVAYTYSDSGIIVLNGTGASFPYPLLDEMIKDYETIKHNVQVDYNPSGSGAGVSALIDKIVDFAGSDAPLSTSETEKAPNTLHIPETIGSIAIVYNIADVPSGLKLTGQIVADIFQGKITKWNDSAITKLNPEVTLPSDTINVIHRSDSSGTTFIFTGYLSTSSTSWKNGEGLGQGKAISWPTGIGAQGNAAVAQTVNTTKNSIGYVELAYAIDAKMTYAAIQNPSGNYILPTLESTTVAAQARASSGLPAGSESWSNVNLLNANDANAYPIVGFSYIMVYKELDDIPEMTQERATAICEFLWYVIHDGQNLAKQVNYAPLPSNVVEINSATIKSITFNNQPVLK
ncbi:MAG: phosphate ABC transporter substrate-binding protein PstS [Nitrososphaerota archaeon]|uniref:phosphate ABC transporter substrate-binding protein PstS n=1 Tax=Candidatus Bathycorpusculum sp. TaxID=2994959 RepID=UPI00282F2A5E|nr:phosphate ABC transporter substrate-binding protein PstS [Candidatus Termiticorpusculum sp.]MCL2257187.1 phosphate ABC transporter substrate-binding protein PstS [Candidatus Termiticorpusculum sp.]MCL2292690.1 phosphate ABC transporter substrate-binding protein PstS [Candidatus Termiticorpusculum sp.]MDR0461535.1 phosphate ABC transporter substrate-binding protein PstS [Nitrososphaerota archaeon]